jgi:hypothetical protein
MRYFSGLTVEWIAGSWLTVECLVGLAVVYLESIALVLIKENYFIRNLLSNWSKLPLRSQQNEKWY